MVEIKMGEVLRLKDVGFPVLVLSKDFFNKSGMIVACPIAEKAAPDALHIPIHTENLSGIALLEHLKSLDIRARFYKSEGRISFEQIQDIADAVQSIFDYYPFSLL